MAIASQETAPATRAWVHILIWTVSLSGFGGLVAAQFKGAPALVGVGILIGMSAATVGASFGFLFAVPRVLSAGRGEVAADAGPGAGAGGRLLGSNTNLERISDWLTTMLVGVGLSQLSSIGPALEGFSAFLARTARVGVDGTAGPLPSIGPFLLIMGLLSGFLFFYLQTRLILVPQLRLVEEELNKPLSEKAIEQVKESAEELASKTNSLVSKEITKGQSPSVDISIRLMREWLYQKGGYRKVIDLAKGLKDSPAARLPDFWFLLTAANGQMHRYAQTDEEKEVARKAVIEATRAAISLDATYKRRIWDLTNPLSYDNDLATLQDDEEFQAMVGKSKP